MSRVGRKQGLETAASRFKLVSLHHEAKDVSLDAAGSSVACGGSVHLTVDSGTGEALLEIDRSLDRPVTVKSAGTRIMDVAHLTPGESIEIDNEHYVYMKPLQVFFHTGRSRQEREDVLRAAIEGAAHRPTDALTLAVSLPDEPPIIGRILPKTGNTAGQAWSKREIGRAGTYAAAGVVAALLAAGMMRHQSAETSAPAQVPQPELPVTKAPVLSPLAPVEDAPAEKAPVAKVEKPSAPKVQPSQPAAKIRVVAPPPVDPVKEAKWRERLTEYQLEAKFDPEGTLRKLEVLAKEVPNKSALAPEIRRQMERLKH